MCAVKVAKEACSCVAAFRCGLQDELQMLKGKLQLSEGQASGHLRAESQVQTLQRKWLDARLQCQASEEEHLKCRQLFQEEEHAVRRLEGAKKRHMESAEEARDALDKLQTKSQRLELQATSQARRLTQEEQTLRGMEEALQEAHQELHRFRSEQQAQLADTIGAKVRLQCATESFEEELSALRQAQTAHAHLEAQSQAAQESAEQRLQRLSEELTQAAREENALLEESRIQEERIARLEEAKNAAALQQAVECASLWTESGTPSRDGASRSVGPPVVTDQPASERSRQLQLQLQQVEAKQAAMTDTYC
ncbi:unnamed protein product [Durusdinium trenchii]|uniref:Uncharacterized protein n=1 Tax=Durusdinium trenchii TaxID=1381693 RepID=A0ABP0PJF7_9DINO